MDYSEYQKALDVENELSAIRNKNKRTLYHVYYIVRNIFLSISPLTSALIICINFWRYWELLIIIPLFMATFISFCFFIIYFSEGILKNSFNKYWAKKNKKCDYKKRLRYLKKTEAERLLVIKNYEAEQNLIKYRKEQSDSFDKRLKNK